MGQYFWGQPLRAPQVSKGHEGHDQEGLQEEDSHTCSVYVYWCSVYFFTGDQFICENHCDVSDLMTAEAVARKRGSTSSSSSS